jgi:peptide/nickel transport system permease protein
MPGSIRVFATSERRLTGGAVGLVLTLALAIVAVLAGTIAPIDPFASVAPPLSPPSRAHAFGTDDLGRDLLAGIVHGARTSLLIMFTVTALASLIGVTIGTLAGYRAGAIDDALMRVTELAQIVPRFFLAVVVIALFGPGLDRLILVLGLTSWPSIARIVRAETLTLAHREFVEAARALGAPAWRTLVRHVLPNAFPSTVVVISVNAGTVILMEAGLGFIGLGDPHSISWGYLANNAQRFLRVAWWMALFPGAAIATAVLGVNLLSDGLNDLLGAAARRGIGSWPARPPAYASVTQEESWTGVPSRADESRPRSGPTAPAR